MMNYSNIITNISQVTTNFTEICEINQFNMLESIKKYPKIVFYLSLGIFVLLFIDRIILPAIPKLQYYIKDEAVRVASALSLANIYFISMITFNIGEKESQLISYALGIFAIILFGILIYTKREAIKKWINSKEE